MATLSTKPLKGFRDFFPEGQALQNYIFGHWQSTCESFGFNQYNGPVLEPSVLYSQSGDDIGSAGKDLYSFIDRGGREISLRPEMTPTVGRMVADRETDYPKPIRWYSIPQCFRAENPQKGRMREFYQLNCDIFGIRSPLADSEIIQLAIEVMKSFGGNKDNFSVQISNRQFLIEYLKNVVNLPEENILPVVKIIDTLSKRSQDWFVEELSRLKLSTSQIQKCLDLMDIPINQKVLGKCEGFRDIEYLKSHLVDLGYGDYVSFNPTLARGLDYYTGMIFEVFDNNPSNRRSLFGGGRYDNLLQNFQKKSTPAVGFGMGDITLIEFLSNWDLLPKYKDKTNTVFLVIYPGSSNEMITQALVSAQILRDRRIKVETGLDPSQTLAKQFALADKKSARYCILIGPEEFKNNKLVLKDMGSGNQTTLSLEECIKTILEKIISQ